MNAKERRTRSRKRDVSVHDRKSRCLAQAMAARDKQAALEADLLAMHRALAEREARLGVLARGIADRDRRIADLEGSRSWRFTGPLRRAYDLARRLLFNILPDVQQLTLSVVDRDPEIVREGNGEYWRAATIDPQFNARVTPGGIRLPPGWYAVRVNLVQRGGHVAGPRLYVPCSLGRYSEFHSVELKSVEGAYAADVFLSHHASEFRFDPSVYPCDFDCQFVHLTPVSGTVRWLHLAAGLFRAAARLSRDQLSLCAREGRQILRSQGLPGLLEAAFWAFANHARTPEPGYAAWVRQYATPSVADLADMAKDCARLERQPLISLITPVYNTPAPHLCAMVESVLRQVYPRWELCLADDASTAAHVRAIIAEYAARDPRIKVAWRDSNGHISAASNTAIRMATGDFLALLDHDDELTPDALFWVARELNEHPDAALVYSDEDRVSFDGSPVIPYFKSDWNYDLFLSHNLITHLGVYRADLVRQLGGFREEFTGAQDYDLALRFIERIEPAQIRHIPRVLYHWRMVRGSTAIGPEEKSYAAERSRRAIAQHLHRKGIGADVEIVPEMGAHRVHYHVPQPGCLATIIIPTRNAGDLVRRCIESIVDKTTYAPYEILLVDNGSDDPAALAHFHELRDCGIVRLLDDPLPFNYARINNTAAKEARGDYLVLLNNDTEVITHEWLTELVSHAQRPEIGAVGAKLWYPDDTLQHGGLVLVAGAAGYAHARKPRGDHGYFGRASLIQTLSAVTAACLCIRRSLFEEIGGFDEALAIAFNDVDICLRLQAAGYRNLYTPYAELYHHESATRGFDDTPEKILRSRREVDLLRSRWMPVLMNDPHYNPNFTLTGEPFSLAWPPRVEPFRARARAR